MSSTETVNTNSLWFVPTGNRTQVYRFNIRRSICKYNYILFTKLPWPGISDETFRALNQAATCPLVYHTGWKLYTTPVIAKHQVGSYKYQLFRIFGLIRPRNELLFTVSVADGLCNRPLIRKQKCTSFYFRFRQLEENLMTINEVTMSGDLTAQQRCFELSKQLNTSDYAAYFLPVNGYVI